MSEPKSNPQAASLGYWVFRLNRAMYAEFTQRLSKLGVSSPQWTVLSQCGTRAMTPVDLANYMQIDRSAVTRLIAQLEKKGLLRRTPHPADGRSSQLSLTTRGLELLPKLIEISKSTNEEFMALLPPKSAKALLNLLVRMGERLPGKIFPLPTDGAGD
jgi:DNA-binding MarR family transcriptional regulator